jgi:hypothetical protein
MQPPIYPWNLDLLLRGRPTVGGMLDLCEENYRLIERMSPRLQEMSGRHLSRLDYGMDLHMEILEQSRYTSVIHMTYYFAHADRTVPDPDATVRAYHDAGQAEVIDLRQSALPFQRAYTHPALEQKWRLNLFLSKWLSYCVQQGHYFLPEGTERRRRDTSRLLLSCP